MGEKEAKKWKNAKNKVIEILRISHRSRIDLFEIITGKENIIGETQLKKIIKRMFDLNHICADTLSGVGGPVWYYLPDKEHKEKWERYRERMFRRKQPMVQPTSQISSKHRNNHSDAIQESTLSKEREDAMIRHTKILKVGLINPWIRDLRRVRFTRIGIYFDLGDGNDWIEWFGFGEGLILDRPLLDHFEKYHSTIEPNPYHLLNEINEETKHFLARIEEFNKRISEIADRELQCLVPEIIATYDYGRKIGLNSLSGSGSGGIYKEKFTKNREDFIKEEIKNIQYWCCEFMTSYIEYKERVLDELCTKYPFYDDAHIGYLLRSIDSDYYTIRQIMFPNHIDIQNLTEKIRKLQQRIIEDRICWKLAKNINEIREKIVSFKSQMEYSLTLYGIKEIFREICPLV